MFLGTACGGNDKKLKHLQQKCQVMTLANSGTVIRIVNTRSTTIQ